MNFVKSGVYVQEFTKDGVKEKEIDTRDPKEREKEERLRQLPEFTVDPNFKSLAEQLQENEDVEEHHRVGETAVALDTFAPPKVTLEDAEFLESLESEQLRQQKRRQAEEEEELEAFRNSQLSVRVIRPDSGVAITTHDAEGAPPPPTTTQGDNSETPISVFTTQCAYPLPRSNPAAPKAALVVKKKRKTGDDAVDVTRTEAPESPSSRVCRATPALEQPVLLLSEYDQEE